MSGAGGSAQPSAMDVDKEGSKGDEKKDKAANEAAVTSKSAKPHPAKASRPEALGGSLDVTLVSDVRERDRDISDDEFSPTNVCMFPESWEGAMPTSVINKAGGFEQFRNELMRIQKVLDSPALVDLGKVDLDALAKEYVSDEDHESHVDDDGMGPYVDKFSSMGDRDLVPSKQEPPYYEAKAWRTTEEEIERMKNLFPYFRAENYRLMSASTGPIGTKSHVQGVLPAGASLEEALMAKPGVCPITSTYNLTYEGEEIVIDAQSGIVGRIACPAGKDIFHFFPEIRDVSALSGRSSRESQMLLEILSGNTDPTRLNVKPGERAPFLCGTVPDILGGWMSMTLISTLFEALYGIHKCTSVDVATWAGALAKESPSYPPVEILMRKVWRTDGTTVRPNEVLFARSTLIGRDVPFKVFKRWALRDRTPIGLLLRPMVAAEVPYTGYVLLTMAEYRSALKTRCIRRFGKFAITVFPMRPEQVCRGEIMIGMEGAKVPLLKLPSPNNEGEFYVDDRVKYMDKRHVVVAVDLKWMATEEAAGIYKTRRGLIAVREEIHAQGPRRGVSFSWDNAPMHDYWCPRCAHLNMYGTILCNGCHLPIFL